MGRSRREKIEGHWDMSDVVAHRMVTARELRGQTQAWVSERMTRFTRSTWSVPAVSAAEGGSAGGRPRLFTANELLALSLTFDLPIPYFLTPPKDADLPPDIPGVSGATWDIVRLMLVGDAEIQDLLADELGSEYLGKRVSLPSADEVEDDPIRRIAAGGRREITRSSLLAAALYRFMTSKLRGAPTLSSGTGTTLEILDALRMAVETIENNPPERFLDVELAGHLEEARRHDVEEDS
jgi:hypothetical protein